MNELKCTDILIEELPISPPHLNSLKREGFTTVGELMEFFQQVWAGQAIGLDPNPDFLRYFDDTVNKLKEIGCWPESLED